MLTQDTRIFGCSVRVAVLVLALVVLGSTFSLHAHAAQAASPSGTGLLPSGPADREQPVLARPSAVLTDTGSTYLPLVVAPHLRAKSITATDGHACLITSEGKVQCWGLNNFGQLGPGQPVAFADAPVTVAGLDEPISRISAGGGSFSNRQGVFRLFGRTCAVAVSGAVQCWGDDIEPAGTVVTMLETGATDVSTSPLHACVLMADKTVRCWGANRSGEVGDGTRNEASAPVPVIGLGGPAVAVTVGSRQCSTDCSGYSTSYFAHSCALIQNGDVQCWGDNYEGQLGNGQSGEDKFAAQPVKVKGLNGQAVSIHAYGSGTCALLESNAVKCWGGTYGAQPKTIQGITNPVNTLFDGCGMDAQGRLQCWWAYPEPATMIENLPVPVLAYAVGSAECLVGLDGSVWCNGYNGNGELGNGQGGLERPQPVPVYGLAHGVTATAGTGFACAIVQDGGVRCWGQNEMGQLGDGSTYGSTIPVSTIGLPHVAQISAGVAHVCARTNEGGVACWGANDKQQIGGGAIITNTVPFTIAGLAGVSKLAAGGNHTCAVPGDGDLRCWGDSSFGQLGAGDLATHSQPQAVIGLAGPVAVVGAGAEHTCALLQSGAVQCWGGNQFAQLGIGTQTLSETVPITVTGLASGVTGLAVGAYHTCAVVASGKVQCWGAKAATYIGSPGSEAVTVPMEVTGIEDVVELAAGGTKYEYYPPFGGGPPPLTIRVDARTCAIAGSGSVKCWQMGQATLPAEPEGLDQGTTGVTVGAEFACAVMDVGGVRCWGKNDVGQLGNASPWSPFWVRVTGF